MAVLTALIVDDDPDFRGSMALLVGREGFRVREAASLAAARSRLAESPADLVLVDLQLPDGDGLDLAVEESARATTSFVVITGNASVDSAVDALRKGALDYLTKPVDHARLQSVLAHVSRAFSLRAEVASLRGELRELGHFGPLIGRSKPMQEVFDLIARVAPTEASVMVMGESGTGKELVAQTIHSQSRRKEAPFVAINCGAISPNLIESELFGHEKGSFTGADRRRRGFFEQADGGTLFLDEITEMPLELQVKLLRVLETRSVTRVGSAEAIPVDVRVIAATNRDLRRGGGGGRAARGPALPAERLPDPPAAAARARRGHRAARRALPGRRSIGGRAARSAGPKGRSSASASCPGRATCASCATPSSAPPSSPTG